MNPSMAACMVDLLSGQASSVTGNQMESCELSEIGSTRKLGCVFQGLRLFPQVSDALTENCGVVPGETEFGIGGMASELFQQGVDTLFVVEKNEPFFSFDQCKNIHFSVHGHLLMPIFPVLPHGASPSLESGETSIPCYRRSSSPSLLKILVSGQTGDENVLYFGITVVMRPAFRIIRVGRPERRAGFQLPRHVLRFGRASVVLVRKNMFDRRDRTFHASTFHSFTFQQSQLND